MKNKIILIGGAPTVGKTYAAKRLAKILSLPWISTDSIREMMYGFADKKKYPALFKNFPPMKAEKYLKKYSPKEILENQNRESAEVWKGVENLINADYVWESFIVEGVAILPSLVYKSFKGDKRIKPVFLINNDRKQIRKAIFSRGLYDDAETYPDDLKEVEVEWAFMFNNWIKKEADRYGYKVYNIKKLNYPITAIIKLLGIKKWE